jgi:hypothetical protein
MLNDTRLCFGITVGILVSIFGAVIIPSASVGWSLLAVGIAVAAISILSYRATANHSPAPAKLVAPPSPNHRM